MDSGRHQLPGAKSSTISKWPCQYLTRLPHGRLVVGRCHLGMVRKSVYPDFFGPFVIICAPFSHPTAAHLSCTHLNGRKSLMCKKYIFVSNHIEPHFISFRPAMEHRRLHQVLLPHTSNGLFNLRLALAAAGIFSRVSRSKEQLAACP